MGGSPKSGAMCVSTAMPTKCWLPPAPYDLEDDLEGDLAGFPKINHERVKSAPQIEPYGTYLRPARECRCRTVPVIIIPITTTPTIMAGRRPAVPPTMRQRRLR